MPERTEHVSTALMWLSVGCPLFGAGAVVKVDRLYARVGERLAPGAPLCDLRVDLTSGHWMDCPAVSTSRISLREPGWIRSLAIEEGGEVDQGALIGLLSAEADEPEQPAARGARINVVTIVREDDWWAE